MAETITAQDVMFKPKMNWHGPNLNSFELPWLLRFVLRLYRVEVRNHPNGMLCVRGVLPPNDDLTPIQSDSDKLIADLKKRQRLP